MKEYSDDEQALSTGEPKAGNLKVDTGLEGVAVAAANQHSTELEIGKRRTFRLRGTSIAELKQTMSGKREVIPTQEEALFVEALGCLSGLRAVGTMFHRIMDVAAQEEIDQFRKMVLGSVSRKTLDQVTLQKEIWLQSLVDESRLYLHPDDATLIDSALTSLRVRVEAAITALTTLQQQQGDKLHTSYGEVTLEGLIGELRNELGTVEGERMKFTIAPVTNIG